MKEKKATQYKFQVPADLGPCVYRPGVGCFYPDAVMTLPDKHTERLAQAGVKEVWNRQLIPLSQEAYRVLKEMHNGKHVSPWPDADEETLEYEMELASEEAANTSAELAKAEQSGVDVLVRVLSALEARLAAFEDVVAKASKPSKGSKSQKDDGGGDTTVTA